MVGPVVEPHLQMVGLVLAHEGKQHGRNSSSKITRLRFRSGRDISADTASLMVMRPSRICGDGGDDRRVDVALAGDPRGDARRRHAFGERPALQALAAAERQPVGEIARLRRGAGEQQVAETGKAHQRFGLGTEGLADAPQFDEAARHHRGLRAGAEPRAGDGAGGDGKDVLQRAADLDARPDRRSNSSGSVRSRSAAPALPPAPRPARRSPPRSAGPWRGRWRSSARTVPRPDCPAGILRRFPRAAGRSHARCPWRRAPAARPGAPRR